MAVEPQVQQFIDFIRDEMPRRIKTNPNNLPDAQKLLVSVSGTLEVIYKTLEELDIAIKSDVDTELTNKEPTITEGTSEQYFRGDKTWQTLNTGAVSETESRVYLNPEQKTVATQAASSSQSGYLTSTDWSTFNGKQAALADVITADTYGSSTQYPVITFNAKGIATAVTLQTVPLPTFTDATFSVQKAGSPSIAASWDLTALTASRVHTYPDKAINFGDMPSVATTNSNSLSTSSTACTIVGGYSNTVNTTAYGCSIVASESSTISTDTYMAAIVASKSSTVGTDGSYDGYNAIISSYSCTISGTDTQLAASISSSSCTLSAGYTAAIGSSATTLSAIKQVAIGSSGLSATTWPLKYSVAIGAANALVSPKARRIYAPLHGMLTSPANGNTLKATTDTSQTLSEANCLRLFVGGTSTASYDCNVFHVTITVAVKTALNTVRAYKSLRTVTVIYGNATYITNVQETLGTDVDHNSFSTYYSVALIVDSANKILYPELTVLGASGDTTVTMSCFVEADYHI